MKYTFSRGHFDFAVPYFKLDGREPKLAKKAAELLELLVRNRDRFIGENEIRSVLKKHDGADRTYVTTIIHRLRKKLGLEPQDLIETYDGVGYRWVGASLEGPAGIRPLTKTESAAFDEKFKGWESRLLYDDCASLAEAALVRAQASVDAELVPHWAERAAHAYRLSGRLVEALDKYTIAGTSTRSILGSRSNDRALTDRMELLEFDIGFGQTIVDAFQVRGALPEAFERHVSSAKAVNAQLKTCAAPQMRGHFLIRRTHAKRQQAEMLRCMGQYGEALRLIREVHDEYPEPAEAPRNLAQMGEADCLRLCGKHEEAIKLYDILGGIADFHELAAFSGWVLLRKARAIACREARTANDREERSAAVDSCIHQAETILALHRDHYRFLTIYTLLGVASSDRVDPEIAERMLTEAEQFGPLGSRHLVAEYAHVALCRAEINRGRNSYGKAAKAYTRAFDVYSGMETNWGIVRAWIGIQLTGRRTERPPCLDHLEGTDLLLLNAFEAKEEIPKCWMLNWP